MGPVAFRVTHIKAYISFSIFKTARTTDGRPPSEQVPFVAHAPASGAPRLGLASRQSQLYRCCSEMLFFRNYRAYALAAVAYVRAFRTRNVDSEPKIPLSSAWRLPFWYPRGLCRHNFESDLLPLKDTTWVLAEEVRAFRSIPYQEPTLFALPQ
jgi:hypothetical protein